MADVQAWMAGEEAAQAVQIATVKSTEWLTVNETKKSILIIKALDNDAHLEFSEFTGKWYVSALIEEGGDGVLIGFTEHCDTPDLAVEKFLLRLKTVPEGKYLVVNNFGQRTHYRWNGAAFCGVPQP